VVVTLGRQVGQRPLVEADGSDGIGEQRMALEELLQGVRQEDERATGGGMDPKEFVYLAVNLVFRRAEEIYGSGGA
jgi:hypothetical protein